MNITDFVKNMNKTFKKYDVKFVANYADVYDSVAVFIKCKEPHIVADYLYNNHFKGVIGTNIGILNNEIVVTFFDFSEYSSSEIEQLIVDAIFGAKARFNLFEGEMMNKKSIKEGIDIKVIYCDDTPSEYIDDVTMNDIYDILDSSSDICKIVDVSGSKKKVVWTDEYGFERAYESKKSAKKSDKTKWEIINKIHEIDPNMMIDPVEWTVEELELFLLKLQGKSKKSNGKSLKEENNRQKVTEGIMNYFKDVFPLIEKDDMFRFSMYTKKDVMIGVELFKDYIFVGIFNLNGKNNLDEYTEIPRETYGTIEDEILYDSDAIWEYLEQYKLVK